MKLLYVIYTHNRGQILQKCLASLFRNDNLVSPTEVLIIDDNSIPEIKDELYRFSKENRDIIPIHLLSFNSQQGLGWQWQLVYEWVKDRDFDFVAFLEQDYVFRQDGIGEAIAALQAKPLSCCVSGYSNPDFYNGKQETLFREVMVENFGEDLIKREYLHKPQFIDTSFGQIQIQFTTNSCGTFICNWKRIKYLLDKYPNMWRLVFERSFNRTYPERRQYAGDGPLTSGISFYWFRDMEDKDIDWAKEGPWIDICDFSISNHYNGGPSLNGCIVPEGCSFVSSPKWQEEYLINNPRKKLTILPEST